MKNHGDSSRYILGVSAFYHDSAACLIKNDHIIAAAQEERFTRIKNDESFPINAINFCLSFAQISWDEIECLVFYDKPWLKFERILETNRAFAPYGFKQFHKMLPVWLKEKLLIANTIHKIIPKTIPIKYSNHHLSHAASAYYPSPFNEAAILTIDGVGEWMTASISHGRDNKIEILKELHYPHSLGLFYSAFTHFCGFKINSGEYKLMGLAPYGIKNSKEVNTFKKIILENLIEIYDDGSLWLNQHYFSYNFSLKMFDDKKWEELFKIGTRKNTEKLDQQYCNLALAVQEILEIIIIKMAKHARELTNSKHLCLAGGVALNCVANSKLFKEKIFDDIWIQPAAGDAGGALGSALNYFHTTNHQKKNHFEKMQNAYLGPSYEENEIITLLKEKNIPFTKAQTYDELTNIVSDYLIDKKIIGWFQGRMEFGPRSLGNRSILANPTDSNAQKVLNLKIKYRESFRPFAPSVLLEKRHLYFNENIISPYMLFTSDIKPELQITKPNDFDNWTLEDKLYFKRSPLPAITHIDYSARIQTVDKNENSIFHQLIEKFGNKSGYYVLVNTSFNVRGEPIVANPADALFCFFNTEIDYLVLGNLIIDKKQIASDIVTAHRKTIINTDH